MTWQQAAILIWLVVGSMLSISTVVRDKELQPGATVIAVLISIGIRVGIAVILSSAGFW